MTRDQVLKGLECCITQDKEGYPLCEQCPYKVDDTTCPNMDALLGDALALLAETEPVRLPGRLVTVDEFLHGAGVGCCEYRDNEVGSYTEGCAWYHGGAIAEYQSTICCDASEYGKTWRLWCGEPTDDQREMAPWR